MRKEPSSPMGRGDSCAETLKHTGWAGGGGQRACVTWALLLPGPPPPPSQGPLHLASALVLPTEEALALWWQSLGLTCCSQQGPPLPGVPGAPRPEHIKVLRGIQVGGNRALARDQGSLKQEPRQGQTRVTPTTMGSGWGQGEGPWRDSASQS